MNSPDLRAVNGRRVPLFRSRPLMLVRSLYGLWLSLKVALAPPSYIPQERVGPLRLFLIDGALGKVSDQLGLTFVPLFALALGASNLQLGILAATASLLGALALPSATYLATRCSQRRQMAILLTTGAARLAYLAIALLPLLVAPSSLLPALIALWATRAFLFNLIHSMWAAFFTELVPHHVRGSYLHDRKDAMEAAAIFALPVAGLIIQMSGGRLSGYQINFVLAFLIGLAGLITFARIPPISCQAATPPPATPRSDTWQVLRSERGFLAFCAIGLLWTLSLQMTVPFLNVYLVTGLGATALGVGTLAAISLLFGLASSHIVADVVRYRGALWVIRLTGLIIPLVPWAWAMVTAAWQVAFLNALSGILWAAYNLAAFRLLMTLAPEPARPQAVKVYQMLIFVSTCAGPLIGGALADQVGFKPVFLISGAGRLLAALLLWTSFHESGRRQPTVVAA